MDRRNFLSATPRLPLQNHGYENGSMNSRGLASSYSTLRASNQNNPNSISGTNRASFGVGQIGLNQRSTEVRKTYVSPHGIRVHQSVVDRSQINDQLFTTITEVTTTKYVLPSQPIFQNPNPSIIRPSFFNSYQPMSNSFINSIGDHAGQSYGASWNNPEQLSSINSMFETIERPSGDGKTHSLPHKKYGPYKCPKCNCEFKISQQFAAHMLTHYKDESDEERKRRLEAKHKKKRPRLASSDDGSSKVEVIDDNGVEKEEGSSHEEASCSNVNGANVDVKSEDTNIVNC